MTDLQYRPQLQKKIHELQQFVSQEAGIWEETKAEEKSAYLVPFFSVAG